MADGSAKRIEDVKAGDKVKVNDPETGERRVETVTAEISGKGVKHLVKVTIDTDGKKGHNSAAVTATDGHPFWVPELNEWIDATDLQPGQWLQTSAGTFVQITAIKRWTSEHSAVYTLTVSDIHTYYVLARKTPVLVHNCGGGLDKNGSACECSSRQPRADPGHVYLGGQHDGLKISTPNGPRNPAGIEINHMPAHSSTDMPFSDGWAIQMDRADHRQLASTGGGPGSAQADYRGRQKALWDSGDSAGAMMMDIEDVRSKFGTKYDGAILQMLEGIGG